MKRKGRKWREERVEAGEWDESERRKKIESTLKETIVLLSVALGAVQSLDFEIN